MKYALDFKDIDVYNGDKYEMKTFSYKSNLKEDKNKKLYLPKGITLNPKDIVDVSYSKASGRSIQYKWGSVTIMTATAKYKYKFVADCESVSKIITDIVYKSKSADIDIFQ